MYEKFTNMYKLSKTLRFALVPQGETLKNIEANGILEEDIIRADESAAVKKLANEYHKAYIDKVLSGLRLQGIEAYEVAYFDKDNENAGRILAECAEDMRKQISGALKSDPGYKDMFSGKMYSEILPAYFASDSEALRSLAFFDRFTTYFNRFNDKKEMMYDASGDKGAPKKGTIACRLIDENLPIYLKNNRKCASIFAALQDLSAAEKELDVFLQGKSMVSFFDTENYNAFLTQKGIDRYNQVIGGYSTEDGSKIKGLNEYINLYNQKAEKGKKLPLLTKLKKQILSDRTTLSFIPEAFKSDEEVEIALVEMDKTIAEPVTDAAKLIENIRAYDLDSIYIRQKLLKEISNKVFDSWHYIGDLLSEKYDHDSGVTEKKRSTKAYKKKKEKALESVKSYSVGELDAMPGIDGKISKYLIGAAGFGKSSIDFARKDMLRRLDIRAERQDRSLRRDDFAKTAIKGYLDACSDFHWLVTAFDLQNDSAEAEFSFDLAKHIEAMVAIPALYNKTRNYLSGKLYSKDQVKLNFNAAEFLGGWSESVEKTKLGTILLRDGEYYLGIIAKGEGDLFAKVPDAKTDDVYKKMRYNLLSGANKTLPHVIFSTKGIEKFKPDEEILRIYKNGTFKKGRDFSLGDCHKLIDFYKDCIKKNPSWDCYNFTFSDTDRYEDISGFFHEVEDAGYSIEFREIDKAVIDDLVKSGKLYLFKIVNKDFSKKAKGTPNLFTLYWKAVFDSDNLASTQFRLNGGAEVFYRKASIKEADIIRHKKGEKVQAKNPLAPHKSRVLDYDIIKDRRFCYDHFQLNVPITINSTAPDYSFINTEAKLAIKNAKNPHVIGVSRGENTLIHITVLDSKGNVVESRSLNVIESANGVKTDYAALLSEREQARDEQRKSWATIEGIKTLKEGYISQVVHVLTELMLKYDAVIAIEDLNTKFKQSRQKIEKAVYQQLEEKLITKLNFLVDKKADPNEPGGIFKGYQLTLPFQSFDRIGRQTGFIFYVSPWNTTAMDPLTGFTNFFDTSYSSVANAVKFWNSFDSITFDENVDGYRFDFDYTNFMLTENQEKLLEGTKTHWSIVAKGGRIMPVKTDKGIHHETVDIKAAIDDLFARYDIGSGCDLKENICQISEKAFHEELLKLFGLTVKLRNGTMITSPVITEKGEGYEGPLDANSSYNIARKGLMLIERIRAASEDELIATGKNSFSMNVSGNEWLKYNQNC